MAYRSSAATTYLIRSATVPAADPITVCFRIQLVTDRNVTGTPFSLFNANGSNYQDVRVTSSGTVPELRTSAASSASSADLAAGTWYHVAYVRSGSAHTLYVDGVSVNAIIQEYAGN